MNRETERLAAESRLEASGSRRVKLEDELAAERETSLTEIRKCAKLGTPKTRIAGLARVERTYVHTLLNK